MLGGRKYETIKTLVSVGVIVIAAFANDVRVAIGLAALVGVVGLGHVILDWRAERVAIAVLERDAGEWRLVPGPNA